MVLLLLYLYMSMTYLWLAITLILTTLKAFLDSNFKIMDLDSLRYFLGIEIARFSKGIHLYQWKYLLNILADSVNLGSKPTKVHMEQNLKLIQSSGLAHTRPKYL